MGLWQRGRRVPGVESSCGVFISLLVAIGHASLRIHYTMSLILIVAGSSARIT